MLLLGLGLVGVPLGSPQWIGEIAVLAHAAVTMFVLLRSYRQKVALVLVLSLVLRLALMFWDLNFRDIFSLPNSGADSEMFFRYAVAVAEGPSLLSEDIRGGAFSKLYGMLFWLTGIHRVVGQYTNVLLGLSLVMIVEATMRHLSIEPAQRLRIFAIAALLPNTLVMSAIFLRESLIAFLIAASTYFFVRWMRGGSFFQIVLALLSVLGASTFHAGVIAVAAGYMVVALLYRRGAGGFGLGWQSLIYLALCAIIIWLVVAEYPDIFLGKFEKFDSEEDLLASTNSRLGGSQYLSGLTVTSYSDMALFGPLRAIYFLGSPMPWDARGVVDLFTFLADSLFYIATPVFFLATRKRLTRRQRVLGYALLIVIVIASLVFGAGVSNAGTAVRHRTKLVALFVLLLAIVASRGPRTPPPGKRTPKSAPPDRSIRPDATHPTNSGQRPSTLKERS